MLYKNSKNVNCAGAHRYPERSLKEGRPEQRDPDAGWREVRHYNVIQPGAMIEILNDDGGVENWYAHPLGKLFTKPEEPVREGYERQCRNKYF